ncbi:MAG TPA: family 10 glycosylhydrolase [Chitinophagaceae bacterium]
MRPLLLLFLATLYFFSCKTPSGLQPAGGKVMPAQPAAEREFRAAWIATVANINWPSKPGLPVEEQKREAIALLDYLKEHNFNAAIFQVRPQADALYHSELEPWSYFLTGKHGQAPDPYYDPLEFWTEAAHDRGLELHVWLNPYRAHHVSGKELTDQSIVKRKPELAVYLAEGYWWMDPAKQGTQDHSFAVVMDLVKRYDIDGVHFDDYFYPYPSYNLGKDFPDSATYAEYRAAGGDLTLGDFRRESVNRFIRRVYEGIKAEKPFVKFGLSPFGMYRPGYPPSIEGFDQYDQLYADAKRWLNEGWIDYFAPQLYWPISRVNASFPVLLGWWSSENKQHRHLWPGISVGRDTAAVSVNETINQVMVSRGMLPESPGVIHWSISSDIKNPKLSQLMKQGIYRRPALVPSSSWLDNTAPPPVSVRQSWEGDSLVITRTDNSKDVFHWIIYYRYGNRWDYTILNRGDTKAVIPRSVLNGKVSATLQQVLISAADRTGNESEKQELNF